MKRVKLYSFLSWIYLVFLGVVLIFTHFKVIAVIWIISVIVFEIVEYRIKYITTCYKMYNKKELKSFNLNKFDLFIERFILKDVRKELKIDAKENKEA